MITKYLLQSYCVPNSVLGAGDAAVNKINNSVLIESIL